MSKLDYPKRGQGLYKSAPGAAIAKAAAKAAPVVHAAPPVVHAPVVHAAKPAATQADRHLKTEARRVYKREHERRRRAVQAKP